MGTTHVSATAAIPPEQFVAALTDFSDRRAEVFGNSEAGYLQVHDRGDTWDDVTDGPKAGGGIWQRSRHDWPTPGVVRLDGLDSNTFGTGDYWEYRVTPEGAGGCRIDLEIHRNPITFKARVLDFLLIFIGRWYHGRDLKRTVATLQQHTGTPNP